MSHHRYYLHFTEELSQASSEFKTTSKKLETKLWWKNFKVSNGIIMGVGVGGDYGYGSKHVLLLNYCCNGRGGGEGV